MLRRILSASATIVLHAALGAASKPDAVVAADGSGQFTSVQDAISAAPMRTGADDPRWVIFVKAGTYRERVYVQRERGNIALVGEDAVKTVIAYDLHAGLPGPDGKPIGTFRTPTVQIDADGFSAENLTFANTAGPVGQALALRVDGDRVAFRRCRFLGWQDTILVNRGRQYFADCYIEGHVDFIFGAATAFFERGHIHCLRDGYITAASTPQGAPHGFVFADCRVTGADGVQTYLGRPWRNYAQTVFLRTEMSAVVRAAGWDNWRKPDAEKTAHYAEFASTGPGAAPAARAPWSHQLSEVEAKALTVDAVLGGADRWNPGSEFTTAQGEAPWQPDLGDGTYRNPVLYADYSDPDAVRVGNDYWMTSSSFSHVPGLPLLHSRDLVNWELVGHALPRLVPENDFAAPQPGKGAWAPAIRYHDGKFWIYYPDPDAGLYVITASDPRGPWSAPVLVKAGRGLIDPCPLWDTDGRVYLVHAWAKSRAGFNNVLTLLRLGADGMRVEEDLGVIVDGNKFAGYSTLEGPKLYRRNGWYYVFAPAGGVSTGWQAVFRAKDIRGPYEERNVLAQGRTPVNGPHQGALVDTPAGESWFLHFQELGAYGRVVHLQPVAWRDDWPVIGADPDGDGRGEPVLTHTKPALPAQPRTTPPVSDEFDAPPLGAQWQWQANPTAIWWSLSARPGALRLFVQPMSDFASAGHLLMQKFPAPEFMATTELEGAGLNPGDAAGLVVFGTESASASVQRDAAGLRVVSATGKSLRDASGSGVRLPADRVWLRVEVGSGARCRFSYSVDGAKFMPLGTEFSAKPGRWVGARFGLFAAAGLASGGHADFNWLRVARPEAAPVATQWTGVLKQPALWYGTAEARTIADNVLLYQTASGGWPKNQDMTVPPAPLHPKAFEEHADLTLPTIDNDATWSQLRFLARVNAAQPDERYRDSFRRGLDYLLRAQYPNGGWPQFYPLRAGYYTHITFNDDAMVGVLELLRDVARGGAPYDWLGREPQDRAAEAVRRGIECILRCQIVAGGVKTAWCAQHDENTFEPVPARKFEHTSLSGFESVGIVRFLMGEDHPSPEIVAAVRAAVAWFERVKLSGIRVVAVPAPDLPHGADRRAVADPGAPPLWARFYEIGTNRPIFGGRDAVIHYNLAEVEPERRAGYRWYVDDPARLLEKDYLRWAAKWVK